MLYLFQRTILNHFQWTRPSPGRLGPSGEGEYVQKNGFGHEDWNFNKSLLIGGHIYGYCYYQPVGSKKDERFNIAFATYTNSRWYLIGFYLNCAFVDNPPTDDRVILHKMKDLKQLGASLGSTWRNVTDEKFFEQLKDDAQWLKWRVFPDDAIRLPQPIAIPKNVFNTTNYRIVKPTEIDEAIFEALFDLAKESAAEDDYGSDEEFPEGRELERKHKIRERNQALVRAAKEEFKRKHGRLYCQICDFDFANAYGDIGQDFIEAHHTIPVSELTEQVKTKISDIALICSNCHRMLHRKRPWLTMQKLKDLSTDSA